ncbi:NlpC/P60 family protein [Leifsonia sp. NPDC102414]|uniref:C40 family peptidase n=1 Tax=Leifsonia sp. NPDC102414 TaxID=3364124 RepID=UPI0038252BEF
MNAELGISGRQTEDKKAGVPRARHICYSTSRYFRAVAAAATASMVAVSVMTPVASEADPAPSGDDVEQAKNAEAQGKAKADEVLTEVSLLQEAVDQARTKSEKAAETYFQAQLRLQRATSMEVATRAAARAATEAASTSRMRAGLVISHLARTAGGAVTARLLANPRDSRSLLAQLGSESWLTNTEQQILNRARQDEDLAISLAQQASEASKARAQLAADAHSAMVTAEQRQNDAQQALSIQQALSRELTAQLASLTHTSQQEAAAFEAAHNEAADAPRGEGAPPKQAGSGTGQGNPPPAQGGVVGRALAYARAQLGKPYQFGGEGPDSFDCSGLTMMSYAAAGVYIGGHSVNSQWYTAADNGNTHAYSDRQPGDLLFWGDAPGDFYHVGIYIGDGLMIAAPTEGETVRIQPVWGQPFDQVARPAG